MTREENTDREPDIVLVILQLVAAAEPGFTPDKARNIEQAVRGQYGGQRVRIVKRKQHPTAEQREKAVSDALSTTLKDVPTDQIAESNGISRMTLYRYLKRGTK